MSQVTVSFGQWMANLDTSPVLPSLSLGKFVAVHSQMTHYDLCILLCVTIHIVWDNNDLKVVPSVCREMERTMLCS